MQEAVFVIEQVQKHYLAQYEAYLNEQLAACSACAAEVMLQLPEDSGLYQNLYRLDFYNDAAQPIEIWPDNMLQFSPVVFDEGEMDVTLRSMRWDAVAFTFQGGNDLDTELKPWFDQWFDRDDKRFDPDVMPGGFIHSVSMDSGTLSVDFGSAPTEAFWDLLESLEGAGVTSLTVTYEQGQ